MQGIQTLGPGVADKMAAMGQFEDDQIAHVAEGEVIVPAPILKYYPEVKDQVFAAIRDQGLEPEQFIVGSEMVAINPNTGVQEFGFFKKIFKKIKKIVKKAAPLLLAAALPMAAPALFGSSAVLGGAVAKLGTASALDAAFKGGNLKDVLRAGATGAAVGGIGQFASNLATGGTGGYISGANYNPAATANADAIKAGMEQSSASTATGTQVADASGATGTMTDAAQPDLFEQSVKEQMAARQAAVDSGGGYIDQSGRAFGNVPTQGTAPTATTPAGIQTLPDTSNLVARGPVGPTAEAGRLLDSGIGPSYGQVAGPLDPNVAASFQVPDPSTYTPPVQGPGVYPPTGGDMMQFNVSDFQGPPTPEAAAFQVPDSTALPPVQGPPKSPFGYKTMEAIKSEFKNNPIPATGQALSYASLAAPLFMSDEMPEQSSMTLNQEELAALLNQGDILNYQGRTIEGMYYNPETESFQDVPYVQSSGIMAAAAGGHIMGPGTGTSDSIPAYLSDGEFVMTADAVKGAGNGDRKKGAANMYAMMSKFEGQA